MDASTGELGFTSASLLSPRATARSGIRFGSSRTDALALAIWQTVLLAAILFHHSNTRLPVRLERALVRVLVTPRMHGIHHSDVRRETDSNWSSILSVWDYLHRTARLDVPRGETRIGVPAYPGSCATSRSER